MRKKVMGEQRVMRVALLHAAPRVLCYTCGACACMGYVSATRITRARRNLSAMPSIFAATDSPCGIFAPGTDCNAGMHRTLAFARPTYTQNASGEVVQTFVPTLTVAGDYQPKPAGFQRLVGGQVAEIKAVFIVMGAAPVHEGYRCYVDGMQLEVVNALRYGTEHTEIEFQQIGR